MNQYLILDITRHFFNISQYIDEPSIGLEKACFLGDRDLAQIMINLGAELKYGAWGACEGNKLSILTWLMNLNDNIYDKDSLNYNEYIRHKKLIDWAFHGACKGDNLKIVNFLIQNGACSWNGGLWGSCCSGNRKMAEYMIKLGARDWNLALSGACIGGHMAMVDWMIELGANDLKIALYRACLYKHLHIVDKLIKLGANIHLDSCLEIACENSERETAEFFIKLGANPLNCFCSGGLHSHSI